MTELDTTRGRVALVTGGSKGIGRAIVERLARDGYRVATCARTSGAAEEVARSLEDEGLEVLGLEADVSQPDEVERIVSRTVDEFGHLHALVNNAGIYGTNDFLELPEPTWTEMMAVNLTGAFLCSQAAARAMRDTDSTENEGGRIVTISSVSGLRPDARTAAYNVSKAALVALSNSMAVDLAGDGILCSTVAPGYIGTEIDAEYLASLTPEQVARLNPLGRVGLPEEVAHLVAFLCHPESTFMTGSVISIDGAHAATSVSD